MCCSEESLELLNIWYATECLLEALADEPGEDARQAA